MHCGVGGGDGRGVGVAEASSAPRASAAHAPACSQNALLKAHWMATATTATRPRPRVNTRVSAACQLRGERAHWPCVALRHALHPAPTHAVMRSRIMGLFPA